MVKQDWVCKSHLYHICKCLTLDIWLEFLMSTKIALSKQQLEQFLFLFFQSNLLSWKPNWRQGKETYLIKRNGHVFTRLLKSWLAKRFNKKNLVLFSSFLQFVLRIAMGRTVSNSVPRAQDSVTWWLEGANVHLAKWEPGVSKVTMAAGSPCPSRH